MKESDCNNGRMGFVRLCLAMAALSLGACHRPSTESNPTVDGAIIYASACARCHGVDGCGGLVVGSARRARNFCDPGFQAGTSDVQLKQAISQGKGMMPAFGEDYSDEQLNALARQIRKFGAGSAH